MNSSLTSFEKPTPHQPAHPHMRSRMAGIIECSHVAATLPAGYSFPAGFFLGE